MLREWELIVHRAIGSPARKSTDLEKCRSIEIGYSTTAAKAFGESLAPQLEGFRSFRFVYLSGMFAEREKDKKLWFLADSRNIKVEAARHGSGELLLTCPQGEAEVGILEIQKQCSNFRVSIVRPGGVLGKGSLVPNFLMGRLLHIKLEELAAAMIDEAIIDEPVGNVEATRTLENDSLRARGRRALAKAN